MQQGVSAVSFTRWVEGIFMSGALITQLRESCDYLRDGGYHETAQLMAMAADEIERLHRERQEATSRLAPLRRPIRAIRRLARISPDEILPSGTVPRGNRT